MHKDFHISIKAVIVENGKALVLKGLNRKGELHYELPGGRIDKGEFIKDAFKRELREEIGVEDFSLGPVVFAYERETYSHEGIRLMNLFYKVDIHHSKIVLGDEPKEFRWITKKNLEEIIKHKEPMSQGIVKALRLVL